MNAKETKQRGIAYCKSHYDPKYSCEYCPLKNEVCINEYGTIHIPIYLDDFEKMSASFNKMIKEIYKDDNSDTVCRTDEKKEGGV